MTGQDHCSGQTGFCSTCHGTGRVGDWWTGSSCPDLWHTADPTGDGPPALEAPQRPQELPAGATRPPHTNPAPLTAQKTAQPVTTPRPAVHTEGAQ